MYIKQGVKNYEIFSDGFYKWLGILASLFLITLGCLHIPNVSLFNRILTIIIFDLAFILSIFIFVTFQFKDRENEIVNSYWTIHKYASNLELEYNKLSEESKKQNETLQWFVNYTESLHSQNSELSIQLEKANKTITTYKNTLPTNLNLLNPENNLLLKGLSGINR